MNTRILVIAVVSAGLGAWACQGPGYSAASFAVEGEQSICAVNCVNYTDPTLKICTIEGSHQGGGDAPALRGGASLQEQLDDCCNPNPDDDSGEMGSYRCELESNICPQPEQDGGEETDGGGEEEAD